VNPLDLRPFLHKDDKSAAFHSSLWVSTSHTSCFGIMQVSLIRNPFTFFFFSYVKLCSSLYSARKVTTSDTKHISVASEHIAKSRTFIRKKDYDLEKLNSIFILTRTFLMPLIETSAEYNQQDATFHNLFISVRRSTCFRRVFRPSSGVQNCTYLSDQSCYLLLAWPG